jgi:hypothetical protein
VNQSNQLQEEPNIPNISNNKLKSIKDTLFQIAGKLYGNEKIPNSTSEEICIDLLNLFQNISNNENSSSHFYDIFECTLNDLKFLKSQHLYTKELEKRKIFVSSETVTYQNEKEVETNTNNTIKLRNIEYQFKLFSLKELYFYLFNQTSYLRTITNYIEQVNSLKIIKSFIQSPFWKQKALDEPGVLCLPLLIYGDDMEPNNPLSSHTKVQKIGGIYVSLMCLPPEIASKLTSIFLAMFYFSEDRKKFSNRLTFQKLVKNLNEFYTDGIPLLENDLYKKVKIISCLLTGDNLGLNQMLGFVESFSANYYCRFCKTKKCDCKKLLWENEKELRNRRNYERDLKINNYKITGIKENSVFNNLIDFHVTSNEAIDVMHDLREGVYHYDLLLILKNLIPKYLNVFELNLKLSNLNYPFSQKKNKPPLLDSEFANLEKLKFTAHESSIFVSQLNMMIANRIPTDDEFWKLYIELRYISKYANADAKSSNFGEVLSNHVANHNALFLKLSGRDLYPKFHNLTHYGRISDSIGLLKFTACDRFEAFHRPFKVMAYNNNNRINLLESLVSKYQINLANKLDNFEQNFSCDDPKSGKLSKVLNANSVKEKYNFIFDNEVFSTKFLYYSNFKYENGVIIILTEDDVMDDDKVFYKVHDILKLDDDYFFCLELLETLQFNDHFYAYEVIEKSEFFVFKFNDLICKKSTVINNIGGKKFVNWHI